MSYKVAWQTLTKEAEYLKVVRKGHWIWIYDNVNVHQKVRHKRAGVCIHVRTFYCKHYL